MRVPFSPSNFSASASKSGTPRRARCLPRIRLRNVPFLSRLSRWRRSKAGAASASTAPEEAAPTNAPYLVRSPRRSESLWTKPNAAWEVYKGRRFSSAQALLDAVTRHSQRFRYRFAIVRLDETGGEFACSSFRRSQMGATAAPRCDYRLLVERRGDAFVVVEWEDEHSCMASFRVRESASHDQYTDVVLERALSPGSARSPSSGVSGGCTRTSLAEVELVSKVAEASRRRSTPRIDGDQVIDFDQMRACDLAAAQSCRSKRPSARVRTEEQADAFDTARAPRLTADQASSLHRLDTPPPSPPQSLMLRANDRELRPTPRAAALRTMGSIVETRQKKVWGHARGETGSLEDLRRRRFGGASQAAPSNAPSEEPFAVPISGTPVELAHFPVGTVSNRSALMVSWGETTESADGRTHGSSSV